MGYDISDVLANQQLFFFFLAGATCKSALSTGAGRLVTQSLFDAEKAEWCITGREVIQNFVYGTSSRLDSSLLSSFGPCTPPPSPPGLPEPVSQP